MKKIFLAFGILFFLFINGNVWADEYAQSDIDEDASTIKIEFTKAQNGAVFSCKYDNNGTIETFNKNQAYSFAETGWDKNTEKFVKLANCFNSAGDYTLTINLVDKAGNTNQKIKSFKVVAGTPTAATLNGSCQNKVANNSDFCELTLVLSDDYGNKVTNQQPKVYSPTSDFSNDANEGIKFRSGLQVAKSDNNFILLTGNKNFAELLPDNKMVKLKALAPSIKKENINDSKGHSAVLSRIISRGIEFIFTNLKKVNQDGTLGSGIADLNFTKSIKFLNPFKVVPSIENDLENEHVVKVELTGGKNDLGASIDSNSGEIEARDILNNLCEQTTDENGNTSLTNCNYNPEWAENNLNDIAGQSIIHNDRYLNEPNSSTIGENSVALVTKVFYKLAGNLISYPAGAVGGMFDSISNPSEIIGLNTQNIDAKFIGADIEGFVAVNDEKTVLGTDTKKILNIGLNSNKVDIYEEIVKNGWELARNSANKFEDNSSFDLSSAFQNNDVAVVDLSGANSVASKILSISGKLPSGQKTLILIDGNLKITGDLYYNSSTQNTDSFGVIILRREAGEYPEVGNIFVNSDVQKIAGSYFADGGFMNNDGNEINTGNTQDSIKQLLLEGSLISRNTLGGSLRGTDASGNSQPDYTPWGTTDNETVSKRYDLHFVRRYYCDQANNSCSDAVSGETKNTAAFIIRPDQKATLLPPPGFKIQ